MNIEISDAANESFVLNKESPSKTFHFTLPDFTFYINHVHFATIPENEHWHQIILKTGIRLKVNYNYIDIIKQKKHLDYMKNTLFEKNHNRPLILN